MKMSTILLRSMKNFAGILLGIALNLYIAFGKITIFTMLILPTQEHGRSFYFLVSSLISFLKDLKFLSYKFSTCLVRVTLRYFMLFVAIVKGVDSLISSQALLSSVYRRVTDFFELILYPATLLKVLMSCRSFLVEFLGSFM